MRWMALALWVAGCGLARHEQACSEGDVNSEIERIVASFDRPEQVEATLAEASAEHRWQLLFAYGEVAGMRLDLAAASERTARLPDEESRWHFWDGYAHAAPWPGDDPAVHVARIRMLAGQRVHGALEDGVLLRFTQSHAKEPALIVNYAARWSTLTGRSPTNGVRIGLQRALGDDLPTAIAAAAALPEAWQPELIEELGWRVGSEPGPAAERTLAHLGLVPEPSRCAFVHGAVRGQALHVSLEDGMALARALPAICEREAWRAIGWTVHQRHPFEPAVAERLGEALSAVERAALLDGYRAHKPL